MTEMTPEQAEALAGEITDAADEMVEAWESFQEAYRQYRRVQGEAFPQEAARWHAYHDAQVYGEAEGWLGGPFLADVIAQAGEDPYRIHD